MALSAAQATDESFPALVGLQSKRDGQWSHLLTFGTYALVPGDGWLHVHLFDAVPPQDLSAGQLWRVRAPLEGEQGLDGPWTVSSFQLFADAECTFPHEPASLLASGHADGFPPALLSGEGAWVAPCVFCTSWIAALFVQPALVGCVGLLQAQGRGSYRLVVESFEPAAEGSQGAGQWREERTFADVAFHGREVRLPLRGEPWAVELPTPAPTPGPSDKGIRPYNAAVGPDDFEAWAAVIGAGACVGDPVAKSGTCFS